MSEDRISVRGIRAFGHHGAMARERTQGQVFEADIDLCLELSGASRSDRLADTVDYADVCRRVERILGGKPYRLLEAVAGRVADELFSAYPQVDRVVVRLRKPVAARALRTGTVEVELNRSKEAEDTGR